MIANPYAGTPTEAGWGMGFGYGFSGGAVSEAPPAVIAPDLIDAFNEGILVGQQCAIDGLPLESECMDVEEKGSENAESFVHGADLAEGADIVKDIGSAIFKIGKHAAKAGTHAICSGVVLLVELAVTLPHHYREPEEVFTELAPQFGDLLSKLGIQGVDVYTAVGINLNEAGCQFRFSRLFKSQDQAREAAVGMGRPSWFVVRWRSNVCGAWEIAEASQ